MTFDVDAVRKAWECFEAGCSGLVAQKCAYHRPYMGCPLDCNDVENAIGEEWEVFRPLVAPLIDEVNTLHRFLDAEKTQNGVIVAERDRLRAWLRRACDELDATGVEQARQWAATVGREELGLTLPAHEWDEKKVTP